jgi:hypothetical protein
VQSMYLGEKFDRGRCSVSVTEVDWRQIYIIKNFQRAERGKKN